MGLGRSPGVGAVRILVVGNSAAHMVVPDRRDRTEGTYGDHLESILRSISFIGPALNPQRFARFHERIRALPGPRRPARTGW